MFDKAKQLWELKRQADELKRELAGEMLEVDRGDVKVRISADLKIHQLTYPQGTSEKDLVEAVNHGIEEAQKVAAKKMQGQLGALQDLLK